MSKFTPFTGPSKTVEGVQAGGRDDEALMETLFGKSAREEYAKECKLGMYTNLSSDKQFNHIDLVPQRTGAKILDLFKSEYDRGRIPSSGVLSIPRILVFLVRTTSVTEIGNVTLRLVDTKSTGIEALEAVDGTQEVTVPISSLPCVVAFSPSYDCPMQVIGGRHRCFGLVSVLEGVMNSGATVVMSHAFWSAKFRSKPNNYRVYNPRRVDVAPFDRLRALDKKSLSNYVKAISNQTVDTGYLLGNASLGSASVPSVVVEKSRPLAGSDKPRKKVKSKRPPVGVIPPLATEEVRSI